MPIYTNNTNRVTGLSGVDTEQWIKQLMQAEGTKLTRVKKQATLLSYKQEAYKNTSKLLKDFQNSILSIGSNKSIRSRSNFLTKIVNINNPDFANVTVNSDAKVGTHLLNILQLASGDKYESDIDSIKGKIIGTEDFNYQDIKAGDNFNVNFDGKSRNISFSEEDLKDIKSNEDFINKLNEKLSSQFGDNKIKASLNDGKLDIISVESGHELRISEGTGRNNLFTGSKIMKDEDWEKLAGSKYTLEVDGKKVEIDFSKFDNDKNKLTKEKAINTINSALKNEKISVTTSINSDGKVEFRAIGTDKSINISGDLLKNITGSNSIELDRNRVLPGLGNIKNGASNILNNTDTLEYIFGEDAFDKDGKMTFTINNEKITLEKGFTLKEMQNTINNSKAGVTFSYNKLSNNCTLESKRTGASSEIKFGEGSEKLKNILGIDDTKKVSSACDAKIILDGIETTRESNEFTIDGLKLTLKEVTKEDQPIKIEVSKDSKSAKDTIKNFVESYNTLIDELNKLVATNRPRSQDNSYYEPLTDEERKELTESEAKAWDEKAKEGLLYRDDIISNLTSEMRSFLNQSVELEDGTKISLYDLGISTSSNYKEKGKLVINESKLDQALENLDGDKIADLFTKESNIASNDKDNRDKRMKTQGLAERLYDLVNSTVGAKGSISNKIGNGVIGENDPYNSLQSQINRYNSKIDNLKVYLKNKEEYYYKMFSKMESVIMQANSQMDYLYSMFNQ